MKRVSAGWVLGAILSVVASLALGLTLVWLNIERMDMAYGLKVLQTEMDEKDALADKLVLERNNLVAPYRLRQLAQEYNMEPAGSGRIRRMEQ